LTNFVPKPTATASRFSISPARDRKRLIAQFLKEAHMRKLITAAVAVLAIGLWLMPIRVAAQGHSTGRPEGAPGGFGSHAPLGGPGADAGSAHGSPHDATTNGPKDAGKPGDAGKKTPDQLLTQNTKLSDNLSNLLSKMGLKTANGMPLTAQEACANFRNLGQCVAAIHVSNNLGIDFNKLACDMTLKPVTTSACPAGTATGAKGISLGASIDALKPGTNGKTEAQKGVDEAKDDMKGSGS
jgi:hypothetical protein